MRTQTQSHSGSARIVVLSALAAAIAVAFSGNLYSQTAQREAPSRPLGLGGQQLKIAATSSNLQMFEAQLDGGDGASEPLELLRASFEIRPNHGNDLLVRFDGECAAWANVITASAEEPAPEEAVVPEVASAAITTWLELDGVPVAIDSDGSGSQQLVNDGTVALCNSNQSIEIDPTSIEVSDDAIITEFAQARTTKGFTWTVPDVGVGFHALVVKARLDPHIDDSDVGSMESAGDALAVVGQRLLVVEQTQLAFEEQPTDLEF